MVTIRILDFIIALLPKSIKHNFKTAPIFALPQFFI